MCGRAELQKLLTMRHKFQSGRKPRKEVEIKQEKEELNSEEELDRQLDEAVKRIEKEKKRAAKKEREAKTKSDLRHKMSVIATTTGIDNDEELNMPKRLWEEVRKNGFEALNADSSEDDESSSESS